MSYVGFEHQRVEPPLPRISIVLLSISIQFYAREFLNPISGVAAGGFSRADRVLVSFGQPARTMTATTVPHFVPRPVREMPHSEPADTQPAWIAQRNDDDDDDDAIELVRVCVCALHMYDVSSRSQMHVCRRAGAQTKCIHTVPNNTRGWFQTNTICNRTLWFPNPTISVWFVNPQNRTTDSTARTYNILFMNCQPNKPPSNHIYPTYTTDVVYVSTFVCAFVRVHRKIWEATGSATNWMCQVDCCLSEW